MDKIVVTIGGLTTIAAIYWFFFGKKDEATEVGDKLNIIVEGGYKPNKIRIRKDRPVTLTFIRKDENSCLEEIIFPDYKIKEYLPFNKEVIIALPAPHKPSEFHCGMNMFHGRIDVV